MIPQKTKMYSWNIAYSTRHMNSLQRCNINNFGFIVIDIPSGNITKFVNKLDDNMLGTNAK